MESRMISDRRSFFGKVFGGALVALGVKDAPLLLTVTDRPEVFSAGWIDTLGNRHEMVRPDVPQEVNCTRWNESTRSLEFMGGYGKQAWVARMRREGWTVRVGGEAFRVNA